MDMKGKNGAGGGGKHNLNFKDQEILLIHFN